MSHRKRNVSTAVAVALALSIWTASPAVSAPGDEHVPPPLACLDVTDGTGGQLVTNEDTDPLDNVLGTADPTTTTVDFWIELAAPSCSDGTYQIDVFDNDGAGGGAGTLLADAQLPGNGTTRVETSFTLDPADADECVVVQVTTIAANGRIVDLAPDDGDGLPLGPAPCPGGGSVWK